MVRFHFGQNQCGHRSRCIWSRLNRRGWKGNPNDSMPTYLRRRISDSQERPKGSQIVWRGQDGILGNANDIRNARQMRQVLDMGRISKIISDNSWSISRESRQSRWRTSTRWWWCVGGIVNWSASNEGQFFFQLLSQFGITPQEWREMDPRDTAFLANAFAEMKHREHQAMKRQQLKARTKRGGR